MPIPVIINPAAHSARAASQTDRIRKLSPAPELHVTDGPGSAEKLASLLAEEGHKVIVAAGGDGTVNEVVNGISNYNATLGSPNDHVSLGILPVGTMNVMAYEMALPGRNLEANWEIINQGATRDVDLWMANDQYFCQLAGVGLDAEIVQQTTWDMKKRFGPLSYVMTAARVLGQEAPLLSVEIDGRPPLFGSVVLVGNGRHYGGPVPVFKNASNSDGLLDIIIFHGRGPLEVFQFLSAMTVTGFSECGDLDYLQAKSFRVTSEKAVPFELDGELGKVTPVVFQPAPFQLKVLGAGA